MIATKTKIHISIICLLMVIVLQLTVDGTKHASRKETIGFKLPETRKHQVIKSAGKMFREKNKLQNIEPSSKKTSKETDIQMKKALLNELVKEKEALNERLWKKMIWYSGYGK